VIVMPTAESYDLAWRLDPSSKRVWGRTTIHFGDGPPGVTLEADEVLAASLRVEALFPFGERGFRRVVDPVDGQVYVYATNFPDAAARTMCGPGDSWTRAPFALTVTVPPSWTCLSNGPAVVDAGGIRTFTPTAPIPRATVSAAAGPFSRVHESVYVPRSRAGFDGAVIGGLITDSIAFYETVLGPYPYPKCDAVFVHDLPSLALSTPGLILFDQTVLDRLDDPRYATTVVSHEVAHAWSGNLVSTTKPLVEGLAVYLSRLFLETTLPAARPWDLGSAEPFPDRPYEPFLARILEVESGIGRRALLHGLRTLMADFAHRHATEADFDSYWSPDQE
jgi:hypothetical protein